MVGQSDTEVTLAYPVYKTGDPLSKPSGEKTVRFQLNNGRLLALEPIPAASVATADKRLRRSATLGRFIPWARIVGPDHSDPEGDPMSQTIEGRAEELLKDKNFVLVSTIRPDGSVHAAPAWVDVQDGRPVLTPLRDVHGLTTSSATRV